MKLLCIVSSPRSGTNHFCELLGSFPNIRGQKELFHPKATFTLNRAEIDAVAALAGRKFASIEDVALTQFARNNPVGFLKAVIAANEGAEVLSFKVFPNHLQWVKVREILDAFPDTSVLVLRRRLIDTYISFMKAMTLDQWTEADTSRMQVILDADEYINWAGRIAQWYLQWQALLTERGLPVVHFDYETAIARGNAVIFRHLNEASNVLGISFDARDEQQQGLPRQDRTSDYTRKVANWAEFVENLGKRGLLPA